jgi:XTP/dITP diphosphohydrolase
MVSVSESSKEKPKLLLATRNRGKVKELTLLLKDTDYELLTLEDLGVRVPIDESGSTFEENATLKARTYAELTGMLTLADDSGLEVDALGGEPGVFSARYGGYYGRDRNRNQHLLRKLEAVPWEKRTARFRCVIAIASPEGRVWTVEGTREGMINYEMKGDNGFGYDPLFFLPELGKTMAELSPEEKNQLSHRAEAVRKAVELLNLLKSARD